MASLRDVILPGVPRSLFGWFLEHPNWRPEPARHAPVQVPSFHTVPHDGLVEPGDLDDLMADFAAPNMVDEDNFASGPIPQGYTRVPAARENMRMGDVEFTCDGIHDMDDAIGAEALMNKNLSPEAYAGELERLVEEGGGSDGGPTLAGWLAGVRDHLRTKPWFRILCELRLMGAERRQRKALRRAQTSATPAGDGGQAQLAASLRELAAALRRIEHQNISVVHRVPPPFWDPAPAYGPSASYRHPCPPPAAAWEPPPAFVPAPVPPAVPPGAATAPAATPAAATVVVASTTPAPPAVEEFDFMDDGLGTPDAPADLAAFAAPPPAASAETSKAPEVTPPAKPVEGSGPPAA